MPRHRKDERHDADAATIRQYFDRAMELKANQKASSREISDLNLEMKDEGVDPGVLSLFCRIAAMPEARASLHLTLLNYYQQALASRLPSPMAGPREVPPQREAGEAVTPFTRAQPAA